MSNHNKIACSVRLSRAESDIICTIVTMVVDYGMLPPPAEKEALRLLAYLGEGGSYDCAGTVAPVQSKRALRLIKKMGFSVATTEKASEVAQEVLKNITGKKDNVVYVDFKPKLKGEDDSQ